MVAAVRIRLWSVLAAVGGGHCGSVDMDEGRDVKPSESLSLAMVGAGDGGAQGRRYLLEDVAVEMHFPPLRPLLRGKPQIRARGSDDGGALRRTPLVGVILE